MNGYINAQKVSEQDFSYTGIIIDPNTSLIKIFELLHYRRIS